MQPSILWFHFEVKRWNSTECTIKNQEHNHSMQDARCRLWQPRPKVQEVNCVAFGTICVECQDHQRWNTDHPGSGWWADNGITPIAADSTQEAAPIPSNPLGKPDIEKQAHTGQRSKCFDEKQWVVVIGTGI